MCPTYEQSDLLVHYSIQIIQNFFGQKIWVKQESGLTTVQLNWDPPVYRTMHIYPLQIDPLNRA